MCPSSWFRYHKALAIYFQRVFQRTSHVIFLVFLSWLLTILTFSTCTILWPRVMRHFKGLFVIGTYFNIQVKGEDAFPGSPFLASSISQTFSWKWPPILWWFHWNQRPSSCWPFSENRRMGFSHFIYKVRMVRVKSTLAKYGCSTIYCSDSYAYHNSIKTFHKWKKDII